MSSRNPYFGRASYSMRHISAHTWLGRVDRVSLLRVVFDELPHADVVSVELHLIGGSAGGRGGAADSVERVSDAIVSGRPWLDAAGKPIHAHGGGLLYEDGVYYWYGENKERTTGRDGVWHWGVRCYASGDLVRWDDLGLIIPPDLDDPASPLHPRQLLDRPHVVVNAETGKYVCWLRVSTRAGRPQRLVVLIADRLLGPYELVQPGVRPLGMDAGDFDIVVDPGDGKAYCYFERVHRELICADLDADYTGFTGYYSTHFPHPGPPQVREAPAYFARGGRHFLITSGTTWYFPNRSQLAVADTYHGPWTVLGDPHRGDPSGTSFQSQVSSVFAHPDSHELYIVLADRWLPDLPGGNHDLGDDYRGDPDTSRASYVWLPLRFDEDTPYLEWRDQWRVDDHA